MTRLRVSYKHLGSDWLETLNENLTEEQIALLSDEIAQFTK